MYRRALNLGLYTPALTQLQLSEYAAMADRVVASAENFLSPTPHLRGNVSISVCGPGSQPTQSHPPHQNNHYTFIGLGI